MEESKNIQKIFVDNQLWLSVGGNTPWPELIGQIRSIKREINEVGEKVVLVAFDSGTELELLSNRCMFVYEMPQIVEQKEIEMTHKIIEIKMTPGLKNCLIKHGIEYIDELFDYKDADYFQIQNISTKHIYEAQQIVASYKSNISEVFKKGGDQVEKENKRTENRISS